MTSYATLLISPLGATILLLAGIGYLWLASMPATGHALRHSLESQYPPGRAESLPTADAIVVLGGAISTPAAGQPYPHLGDASDRLWHAARLYHAGRAPWVLLSGGNDPAISEQPETAAMQVFLGALGVPQSVFMLESRSRSTRENAVNSAVMLRERGMNRILLVTSARHMPRARALFESQGLQVIPAATDYAGETVRGPRAWLPDAHALVDTAESLKEWLGRGVNGVFPARGRGPMTGQP